MTKKSDSPSHSSQPTVACPTCKQSMVWSSSNPNRPFCSERCKLIDLGEWASESYKVAAAPSFDEYDDFSSAMDPNQHSPGTVH